MIRNYDYSKLRGRVIEKLGSLKNYAKELGISETTLFKKLNNKVPFNQDEIFDSIRILDLDVANGDIQSHFFTQKVGKIQTEEKED